MANPTTPPESLPRDSREISEQPDQLGSYRVIERLGTGGMGEVYKAEQRQPIQRIVAIKVIKLGFDSREVIARFESERQALARMDHPHVARVLDAGMSTAARPYFVMEYVPGKPVVDFADDNRLTIRERLELFIQICEAIAHAHTKAVIHRDIKSANVLAYSLDGKPTAKVIDFGIAKALSGDRLTNATYNTLGGQVIGTIDSMSPEQADASPDIDTRTDVYSLGVLLYELLVGARPFNFDGMALASETELKHLIRDVEPQRPSTRLSSMGIRGQQISACRQVQREALIKQLRRELEWIPLMAMRKERNRRYESAAQLADDVRNYLQGMPLRAAPESHSYRLKKFVARHALATVACASVLALIAFGAWHYVDSMRVRQKLAFEAEVGKGMALMLADRDRANLEEQLRKVVRLGEQQRTVAQMLQQIIGVGGADQASKARLLSLRPAIKDIADKLDHAQLQLPPDDEIAVRSMLSKAFMTMEDGAAAEAQLVASYRLAKSAFGEKSADFAATAGELSDLFHREGKLKEAEPPMREALAIWWERLGPRDPATVQIAAALADVLEKTGRPAEANDLRDKCGLPRR